MARAAPPSGGSQVVSEGAFFVSSRFFYLMLSYETNEAMKAYFSILLFTKTGLISSLLFGESFSFSSFAAGDTDVFSDMKILQVLEGVFIIRMDKNINLRPCY